MTSLQSHLILALLAGLLSISPAAAEPSNDSGHGKGGRDSTRTKSGVVVGQTVSEVHEPGAQLDPVRSGPDSTQSMSPKPTIGSHQAIAHTGSLSPPQNPRLLDRFIDEDGDGICDGRLTIQHIFLDIRPSVPTGVYAPERQRSDAGGHRRRERTSGGKGGR
jgi:hypothetical protein